MSKLIFETERLLVRQYTLDDMDHFFKLNSDEEVVRYIRKPKTFEESKQFLEENFQYYIDFPLFGRWAAVDKITNEFIGSFAIIPIPNSTDMQLGYALLKESWGKGYATELTAKGVEYAIINNVEPLYAVTESANMPSQKVLLKNGFEFLYEVQEAEKTLYRYLLKR
jgi:ribosomal-protein-alanine N-acetyltransferase